MKTHIPQYIYTLLVLVGLLLFSNGCDKSLDLPEYQAFAPSTLDENGGNWKLYVLKSATEFTIAEPKPASSTEYSQEIAEIKALQASLTNDQKAKVNYWNTGGVFRWNEIARELAARYNLPPVAGPDGKYPVPDANNPFQEPKFPFSNPPYAARAFAYLAVAQYDGLIAAWKYKYMYKRARPSSVDPSLNVLAPATDLPTYPSEDALVATVSMEILKFMFPTEVEYLTKQAEEHKNSRLWAGTQVRSDIQAGEELGKLVAQKILAAAKADGMKDANNQALVSGMQESAMSRGLTVAWKSQELPYRAPLLPNYGAVKTWNFDEATKIQLRPGPPPAIGSPEFNKDMDELRKYAKGLTREQYRIASFWADGPGTSTPPGHWNKIATNLIHKNKFNELRAARTMALVGTSLMDAGVCCWDTKYYYFYPRPYQMDNSIKTMVGLPNFPSYTSGHSTFSAAAATVLGYLFPEEATELEAKAIEAAESRIYGTIHYRFDSEVGLRCGKNIGSYAVLRGQQDGSGL
jgi:hypothetical protein